MDPYRAGVGGWSCPGGHLGWGGSVLQAAPSQSSDELAGFTEECQFGVKLTLTT